jgi:hypothetical protein
VIGCARIVAGPWNEDYLHELHTFPGGAHDDQVDGSSGAFNKLSLGYVGPWEVTPAPPRDRSVVEQAPPGVFGSSARFHSAACAASSRPRSSRT